MPPRNAVPPQAAKIPSTRTYHGDAVTDDYAWLAVKDDSATIAYLRDQNAYADAMTSDQVGLRAAIFGEIRARTQETDLTVPARKGDWWYYTRNVEGRQYEVHCRRAVRAFDEAPPMNEDGSPLDGEEVLLDGNELAADREYFSLGTFDVSPDGRLLAYSTDFAGDERFTLRIRNLVTRQPLADEIPNTFYGSAWSADGSALFYVTVDQAWRPYRVWRHLIGTPASEDVIVYQEDDERFWVRVGLARSGCYILISSASKLTSEVRMLDAAAPLGALTVVRPRRQGIKYDVEHQGDSPGTGRLLILHNENALNFELAQASVSATGDWNSVIGHRDDTRLLSVAAFAGHLVVYLRRDGLTGLRVLRADGSAHDISFPEPVYRVRPWDNPEYRTGLFRLGYASFVTSDSVYDCDVSDGSLTLLRRCPVLAAPDGGEYDPQSYEQSREWATAPDGTAIPISLVCRKGVPRDGSTPFLLYGYGSYEISMDPWFSIPRLSLLDRGFGYAIAHIRGGGEMGRSWYDDGKLLRKANTFIDFVACARHLVSQGWTSPARLIARGASAGGLLVGVAANMAPEAFGGVVAQVPFVDALTSILNPDLPLTVTEWEEWGDPLHDPEVYRYMKAYTPYENIRRGAAYPPVLALTSLNDTRVLYTEPAKWIARLQAEATGGPFLLKTEMVAGHGGRSGRYDAWREEALILAWIVATALADPARRAP